MAAASVRYTNPIADESTEETAEAVAADAAALVQQREHRETGDVSWLKRRAGYQQALNENGQLNCKYDPQLTPTAGGMRDLGPVSHSWVFIFRMGVKDAAYDMPVKSVYQDRDPIPLEAWQMCSRLWKHNFTIDHGFSQLGDKLMLAIGLPYKELVKVANKMRIKMRLMKTKGSHDFMPEMAELYAYDDPDLRSPFTSALQQILCLHQLRHTVRIEPDWIPTHRVKKAKVLKKIQHWVEGHKDVRARQVFNLFVLFGVYRPHAGAVFGETVKRVSLLVAADEWMVIVPDKSLDGHALAPHEVSYADLGDCLSALQAHNDSDTGRQEQFSGSFETFFPLHDQKQLETLRANWGNFSLIQPRLVQGPVPEYQSPYSMHHPDRTDTSARHFGPFYQPIDEIRDYFGDHVAIYFCWLELYTRALVWPSATGLIGIMIQVLHAESVDENPFTIPYTLFFAACASTARPCARSCLPYTDTAPCTGSITFLGSWKRRENELKFLWGTEGFELQELPRPEFVGAHVVDPETNRDEIVYSPDRKDQVWRRGSV